MRWEVDARNGHLGRTPPLKGGTPQPLHRGVLVPDWKEALSESRVALEVWLAFLATDGAPLYSGGVLDSWPAWVLDVLKVAKPEWASITSWLQWCARKED